jgi:plastocyanin
MKKPFALVLLAACFIIACGCTQSSPPPVDTPVPTHSVAPTTVRTYIPATAVITPERTISVSDNTITIVNNAYTPSGDLTVKVGSTVRWVNGDDHPHRILFDNNAFSRTPLLLATGQSFSQIFNSPGVYTYDCMIYPYMKGTITVVG